MSDINEYAFNIDLSVKSNAEKVLSGVSGQISNLEEQFSDMASKLGDSLGSAADTIESQFSDIHSTASDSSSIFDDIGSKLKSASQISDTLSDSQSGMADALNSANTSHSDALDLLTDQEDMYDDILGNVTNIGDNLEEQEGIISDIGDLITDWAGGLAANILSIQAVTKAWQLMAADEEEFITVNYRLYGSQRQILEQVNDTVTSYGLLRGTAMEAYKVLGSQLRVPREELSKYVAQVSMFNRVTDVSVINSASFVRSMSTAGYTSAQTERQFVNATNAMRQYGLTTTTVESAVQNMTAQTGNRLALWGKEGKLEIDNFELSMRGFYRNVPEFGNAMVGALDQPLSNLSIALRSAAEEFGLAQGDMSKAAFESQKIFTGTFVVMDRYSQDLAEAGNDVTAQAAVQASYMNITGLSVETLGQMYTQHLSNVEKGLTAATKYSDALEIISSGMTDVERLPLDYSKSLDTIQGSFDRFASRASSVWMGLMVAVAPAAIFLIDKVFTPMLDIVGVGVKMFTGLYQVVGILASPFIYLTELASQFTSGFISAVGDGLDPFLNVIDDMYDMLFEGGVSMGFISKASYMLGQAFGYAAQFANILLMPLRFMIYLYESGGEAAKQYMDYMSALYTQIYDFIEPAWLVVDAFTAVTGESHLASAAIAALNPVLGVISSSFMMLGSALEYVVNWFGASGAGVIEESQWAADALNLLLTPLAAVESLMSTTGAAISIATSAMSGLVGVIENMVSSNMVTDVGLDVLELGVSLSTGSALILTGSGILLAAAPVFGSAMTALSVASWLIDPEHISSIAVSINNLVASLADASGIANVSGIVDQVTSIKTSLSDLDTIAVDSIDNVAAKVTLIMNDVKNLIAQSSTGIFELSSTIISGTLQIASSLPSIMSDALVSAQLAATLSDTVLSVGSGLDEVYVQVAENIAIGAAIMSSQAPIIEQAYLDVANAMSFGLDKIEEQSLRSVSLNIPEILPETQSATSNIINSVDENRYQAETIKNVEIKGADDSKITENTNNQSTEVAGILQNILKVVEGYGPSEGLSNLMELLNQWLPKIGSTETGQLGSRMNRWD